MSAVYSGCNAMPSAVVVTSLRSNGAPFSTLSTRSRHCSRVAAGNSAASVRSSLTRATVGQRLTTSQMRTVPPPERKGAGEGSLTRVRGHDDEWECDRVQLGAAGAAGRGGAHDG